MDSKQRYGAFGRTLALGLACCFAVALAGPATAGVIEKDIPFVLDEWYDLSYTEGPITTHRIRVEKVRSNVKSRIFRPGLASDPLIQDVQIQVEYTNESTRDYEADLSIFWVDRDGKRIDGYEGEEDIDAEERHELMTALRSTLVYGLDVAQKLTINIRF